MAGAKEILEIAGHEVAISNPDKVFFPRTGHTKIDLVRYYLAVADGALRGAGGRPMAMKRFVNGAEGEFFFQKRAPEKRPEWVRTVELRFPSGRTAEEVVLDDASQLAWIVNLGCIDLNPHPVRADDLDHPDELRVDLDPVPGIEWPQIIDVALETKKVLEDFGLTGWPKTSGSRGFHINCRIEQRWTFPEVRRAAVALAREVERRAPEIATSRWWKEERHGVFIDYNQNAKDRTVASAYSVRPTPDARVSTPLRWKEVARCDPAKFTIDTVPKRVAKTGDPLEGIDEAVGSLDALLELSKEHEALGFGDAPWPPQFAKAEGEPPRVQPSRRKGRAKEGAVPPPAPGKVGRPHGAAAVDDAAHRDRPRRDRGRGAGRTGPLAREVPGRLAAAGAGRRAGRLDARAQHDVDAHPRQPAQRSRGRAPAAGGARGRLRPLGGRRVHRRGARGVARRAAVGGRRAPRRSHREEDDRDAAARRRRRRSRRRRRRRSRRLPPR